MQVKPWRIKMIKKMVIVACLFVILNGFGYAGSSPDSEKITADQIVSNYFKAVGGLDRIRKVQFRKTLFTVHMQSAPPYRVELIINRKGELKSGRLQGSRHLFFDGQKLWNIQGETRTELKGQVVNQFKKKADLNGPLVDYLQKGITLCYLGKERIEFSWFLKLEVTWPDQVSHILYFDQQSGLLKKKKEPAFKMINGKIVRAADTITCFYDYREINGIKIPFYWVQTTEDSQHVHLFTVESAEIQ
jgi:hypothetical protein